MNCPTAPHMKPREYCQNHHSQDHDQINHVFEVPDRKRYIIICCVHALPSAYPHSQSLEGATHYRVTSAAHRNLKSLAPVSPHVPKDLEALPCVGAQVAIERTEKAQHQCATTSPIAPFNEKSSKV